MSGVAADIPWAEMEAVAFRKEKAHAKRLAARTGVSERDALRQLLYATATPRSLAELIADRSALLARLDASRRLRKQQQAQAWQRKQACRRPPVAHWQGWFDGAASPNPGRIGIGAVLLSPAGVFIDMRQSGGDGDSSDAEYRALIALLEAALQQQVTTLTIYGDSRTVIEDVTNAHPVAVLADYRGHAQRLRDAIGTVEFKWIPRAQNCRADGLSQQAIALAL